MMLHEHASSGTLALLRIAVFGSWLLIALLFSPSSYATLPESVFTPWGVHRIIDLFPADVLTLILSREFLTGLKALLLLGCTLCVLGVRPFKPIALITFLLIFILDFVIRGFNGFINHAQIGIYFSALFLAVSPAADAFSVSAEKSTSEIKDYSFGVILTAITLTMAYSFIGIRRFMAGGMEIFTNDALTIYIVRNTLDYSVYGFDAGLFLVGITQLVILLKAGFLLITILEVLSPFILFNPYLRYIWLIIMIPFHFITLVTMNIFFWENIILILVLFVNWEGMNFKSVRKLMAR